VLLNPPDFYAITFPLQDRATLGKLDGFLDGLGLDDDGSQSGLQRGKRQMEAAIGIEAPQLPIVTLQIRIASLPLTIVSLQSGLQNVSSPAIPRRCARSILLDHICPI